MYLYYNFRMLEQFIKNQGWTTFGVTSFEEIKENLKKHEKIFDEWVSHHYQADMDWLERMKEDRFHPENKLPDVKSIVVLGAVYSLELGVRSLEGDKGVVARYARGKDYHKVLKKKLIELSDWLKNQQIQLSTPNSQLQTYASVDSGPTVDRVLAETAGLGFFGKNTCLIDPSRGSFFFIASLMTNLVLEPTPKKQMPNCGNCQNCIKNCPTGALVEPGKLDARKCISYLTIENKEGIPESLRSKIGNRLFGCDACQEACPFNIRDLRLKIQDLSPECGVGGSLDLKDILSIQSDEEFLGKFAGTPIMRAKRRGLLRNACVVAGNSGNESLIPYLEELIEREKDDIILDHARWAIQKLKG